MLKYNDSNHQCSWTKRYIIGCFSSTVSNLTLEIYKYAEGVEGAVRLVNMHYAVFIIYWWCTIFMIKHSSWFHSTHSNLKILLIFQIVKIPNI